MLEVVFINKLIDNTNSMGKKISLKSKRQDKIKLYALSPLHSKLRILHMALIEAIDEN
jgi:hypothetical protein